MKKKERRARETHTPRLWIFLNESERYECLFLYSGSDFFSTLFYTSNSPSFPLRCARTDVSPTSLVPASNDIQDWSCFFPFLFCFFYLLINLLLASSFRCLSVSLSLLVASGSFLSWFVERSVRLEPATRLPVFCCLYLFSILFLCFCRDAFLFFFLQETLLFVRFVRWFSFSFMRNTFLFRIQPRK